MFSCTFCIFDIIFRLLATFSYFFLKFVLNNKKQKMQTQLKSKDIINLDSNKHYLLGKTIKLKSLKMQENIVIKIVKPSEENYFYRRYSMDSNFARALRGKKVGDVIRVNVIKGYLAYEILSID